MKSKLFRVFIALWTALSFALSGAAVAFADEKAAISYEIEYEEGRTRLTLVPSKDGNVIRYTTDGSKPDKSSKLYSGRLSTKKRIVIRAAEYNKKGEKVASLAVELKLQCADPTLTAEKTEGGFLVSLSSETTGSTIYYTTDGSAPKKTSAVYGEPFLVKSGTTVRAYAAKSGRHKSGTIKRRIEKAEGAAAEAEIDPVCVEVLGYINDCRTENGLSPLAFDESLLEAARLRADELTVSYSHTRPGGTSCYTVLAEVGFDYRSTGENIAWTEGTLSTPEYITGAWIGSPNHLKNILSETYDVTGIATRKVGNVTYWVQIFGKRM